MTAERIFAALIAFALGAAATALALGRPEWVAYAVLAASVAFICWGLAVTFADPSPGDDEGVTPPPATFHTPDGFVRLHYDADLGDYDIRALWPTDTGAPE